MTTETRDQRQYRVYEWAERCFGKASLTNAHERVKRIVEEAIELAQSEGLPGEDVMKILARVYKREPGQPVLEAGQLGLTLLAYAEMKCFSADDAERREVERVMAKSDEHWRARHQAKVDQGIAI